MTIKNIVLEDGSVLTMTLKLVPDSFYGEALKEAEDGNSQEILQILLKRENEYIASGEAGYLSKNRGDHLSVLNIYVEIPWRRKNIATEIYNAVEEYYQDTVYPYPGNEGGAIKYFWHDRLKDKPDVLQRFKNSLGLIEQESSNKNKI